MDFNPTERIYELLGPQPNKPWAALIPQILIWCFRRFCIEKLIAFDATLYDSIWEDHIELVQRYCPKGLEDVTIDWMTEENIQQVHSPLEEYNRYFTDFIIQLDAVVLSDDYEIQDTLSEFLDSKISGIMTNWLKGSPFLIFPSETGKDDEFTQDQLSILVKSLLEYARSEEPPPPEPEPEKVQRHSLLWNYLLNPFVLQAPPPPPVEIPVQLPPPVDEPVHLPPPVDEPVHLPPVEIPVEIPPVDEPVELPPKEYYDPPTPPPPPPSPPPEPPEEYPFSEEYDAPPLPEEEPKPVARAMAYRRTMRKKHRLSRVKTCKRDRSL